MRFGFQTFIINTLALALFVILASLAFVIGDRLVLDGRFTGGYNKTQRIKDLVAQINEEKLSQFKLQDHNAALKRQLSQTQAATQQVQQQMQQTLSNIPAYQFTLAMQRVFRNTPEVRFQNGRISFNAPMLFPEESFLLTDPARMLLDQIARILLTLEQRAGNIPWVLQIGGHTGPQRAPQDSGYGSNWKVGYKRAFGVVQYLISKGVSPDRLYITSFSQYQPDTRFGDNNRISFRFDYR